MSNLDNSFTSKCIVNSDGSRELVYIDRYNRIRIGYSNYEASLIFGFGFLAGLVIAIYFINITNAKK